MSCSGGILQRRREDARAGTLAAAYHDGLAVLPGWQTPPRAEADEARWHDRLKALVAYREAGNDWPRHKAVITVWELSLNGGSMGWVTTAVMPTRLFPFFWLGQARVWTQVHWLDGQHEYLQEDYGPDWPAAEELRDGYFVTSHPRTHLDFRFDATAVTGPDCDRLWAELEHGVEPYNRNT
ncbi:hypothetical protein [Arthrobacter sp. ISL-65]|uniref:hypothetical protein n=1 Tax=Arthrobacter sp. ISL-65 TaxID=2819112 RepID=UPI001BEC475A|nr:hypothetical protein [Arthrobacter sp. ISL-65]MBT2548964.1 hypothetical protein [Arthrobacter sp. ISL-65]